MPATGFVPQLDLIEGLAPTRSGLAGIIDIGSNSIRLVVYQGLSRVPPVIFNEKVMAGLGRGVAADGRLDRDAMGIALDALSRFAMLAQDMGVTSLRTVATAAVREASNGVEFVALVYSHCGLAVEIIDGKTEARAAALGVIAGIPEADGVMGDLGGGSLELVRVAGGKAFEWISLPIGSLRLDAVRKRGQRQLGPFIRKALDNVGWANAGLGKPFYMVGGSWRALTQLHIHMTDYPLPVVHQYSMDIGAPDRLARSLAQTAPRALREVRALSNSRIPSLPGAATLLGAVVRKLGSSSVIASAYGLREGLLFAQLPTAEQREDPLLAAARHEGERQGRFPEHGDLLMTWMDGLFEGDETGADRRLRWATSLLSDVAWRAHPDFRAERGLELALHGNWVAITAPERAMLAAALFACFGGSSNAPQVAGLSALASPAQMARARSWGMALRLGQRLTGGTAKPLVASRLWREREALVLSLAPRDAPLYGEVVARRLKALAGAFGLVPEFRVS